MGGDDPLGERRQFSLEWFGDGEATKEQLAEILRGKAPSGPPAILFTGSHGGEWPMDDPAAQRQMQGALVTQEFNRGTPLGAANVFSAGDVPADAQVHGMMAFMFACYSGGCPTEDNYFFNKDGSKIPVAPEALIAKLSAEAAQSGCVGGYRPHRSGILVYLSESRGNAAGAVDSNSAGIADERRAGRPGGGPA